ncbi:hypothetical protein, partial [Priestia flexa]|uniref:hypothetical protein n=1 Tax=Priestia flexa TaxID=86664 RepID=UPI001A8F155C
VMGDFYGKRRFVCEMFTCFTIKNEKSLRLTRTLQVSRQSGKSTLFMSVLFLEKRLYEIPNTYCYEVFEGRKNLSCCNRLNIGNDKINKIDFIYKEAV